MQTLDFNVAALRELGVTEFVVTGNPTTAEEYAEMVRVVVDASIEHHPVMSCDPSDIGATWEQFLAKRDELEAAEPLKLLREERNKLLAETDWWLLPDRTATQAQLDYRQALRDITTTYTSLDDVVWPEKPL